MKFVVGQRWISNTELNLGLGLVSEIDGRRVVISFPAAEEVRAYAADTAPLSRILYSEGDHVTAIDGQEFTVTRVEETSGLVHYFCRNEASGHSETLPEWRLDSYVQFTSPLQRMFSGQIDHDLDYQLRIATLQHLQRLQQSSLSGLLGARTSLLPHQVSIAHEVANRYAPRVLLADEAGLGKTIEAGMIAHAQLHSGQVERILILTPDSLIHQWFVEMLRKFSIHFSIFDQARYAALTEEGNDKNPFETEQMVLCPLSFLVDDPEACDQAITCRWDLLIVDEAHHLHWSEHNPSPEYRIVESLAQHAAGLLLLTATPEQVGVESHYARLRLLDPARFYDLNIFKAQAHDTDRVMFRNTRSSIPGFPAREVHAYPLPLPESYAANALYPEQGLEEAFWLSADARVAWLEQQLKQLKRAKALVICRHAGTAKALDKYFNLKAGIRSTAFYEGLTIIERDRAAAYFADEEVGAQVLVCSEIGSEGRNFQFAHHLILFDLPDNPDLLEQRIGRLDRIGQLHVIQIHVPYFQQSAQEVLFRWYHEGLNQFARSCSVGYAIHQKFADRLTAQLESLDQDLEALLCEVNEFTETTLQALQSGNNVIAYDQEKAQALIQDILAEERSDQLQDYMEQVFNQYGVEQEVHSGRTLIVRPGDHQRTDHFPGLKEEGVTVTFDRDKALVREDMLFLSWEHPMVSECMEMILSSELGNASVATIAVKGLQPGTLLLESWFRLQLSAQKKLQLGRFLPLTSLRFLVDVNGKNLSEVVPHHKLNELCTGIKKKTAQAIVGQVRENVEIMVRHAQSLAQKQLPDLVAQAKQKMAGCLGQELQRLIVLKQENPDVRAEEVEFLRTWMAQGEQALERASMSLEGLRVMVNNY